MARYVMSPDGKESLLAILYETLSPEDIEWMSHFTSDSLEFFDEVVVEVEYEKNKESNSLLVLAENTASNENETIQFEDSWFIQLGKDGKPMFDCVMTGEGLKWLNMFLDSYLSPEIRVEDVIDKFVSKCEEEMSYCWNTDHVAWIEIPVERSVSGYSYIESLVPRYFKSTRRKV